MEMTGGEEETVEARDRIASGDPGALFMRVKNVVDLRSRFLTSSYKFALALDLHLYPHLYPHHVNIPIPSRIIGPNRKESLTSGWNSS